MGVDTRKPPLPAPTEDPSSMDNETDLATDLSRRTDRTSYSIPEDGSPITISTTKLHAPKDGKLSHGRQKSQTSLLIEYFEAGKMGDKSRAKPSVRVKVTPSGARKSKSGSDAVQITGIGKDRKPSYTRRISLGSKTETVEKVDGTEVSRSTDSNVSARPPIEIEVLDPNNSDLSTSRHSRDLRYLEHSSDISSMPPDSLLETTAIHAASGDHVHPLQRKRSRSLERQEHGTTTHLDTPGHARTRSLSRERITQKVMEKLAGRPIESSSRKNRNVEYEPDTKPAKERRRRSSKSQHHEEVASPGSSQLSSNVTASQTSYRSGNSKVSLNNPKLLEMVEDTVKRLILPELHQMRKEQKTSRNLQDFDDTRRASVGDRGSYQSDLHRSVSKSSSTPNIRSKPKVVLNRYDDDPGQVLSRGDSERIKNPRSGRDQSDRRRHRSSIAESVEEEHEKKDRSGHKIRDAAAGAIAGGILTAAAIKHHNRKDRSHSRSRRSRSDSITDSVERLHQERLHNEPGSYEHHELASDVTESTQRYYDNHTPRNSGHMASYSADSYVNDGRQSRDEYDSVSDSLRHNHDGHRRHKLQLPFTGGATESDITRASIMSASTDGQYYEDGALATPTREVSRGTTSGPVHGLTGSPAAHSYSDLQDTIRTKRGIPRDANEVLVDDLAKKQSRDRLRVSSSSRATSISEHTHKAGTKASDHSIAESYDQTTTGNLTPTKSKWKHPALAGAAAGIGGAVLADRLTERRSHEIDETERHKQSFSPAQSVSTRGDLNDPLIPAALNTRSPRSTESPLAPDVDSFAARSKRTNFQRDSDIYDDVQIEDPEAWFQHEHEKNEQYRNSLDEKRMTDYTVDSLSTTATDREVVDRDVRDIAANPHYVLHPAGVESAVASLIDPSNLSSHHSSALEASNSALSKHDDLVHENITQLEHHSPNAHELQMAQVLPADLPSHGGLEISPIHQLKQREMAQSPRQSEARSSRERLSVRESTPVHLGASGMPDLNDPMPEIGHGVDSPSEASSIRSIPKDPTSVKGSRERIHRKAVASPRQATRNFSFEKNDDASISSHEGEKMTPAKLAAGGLATGIVAGAAAAAYKGRNSASPRSTRATHRATVDDVDEDTHDATLNLRADHEKPSVTPTNAHFTSDEGYVSGAYARSLDTPREHAAASPRYFEDENGEYDDALQNEDPFLTTQRASDVSGISQGMESPLYDSATGQGLDRIQSKDVVALMDHLTVRDAQRNARDTEILVTLVRSAAEMRQNIEELKRFITEQDRMIMKNTDRNGEATTQKILSAASNQKSPRPLRPVYDVESLPDKRQNVFKRALKGLSGRNSNDLGRMEEMLMQVLDDVETLKEAHQTQGRSSWDRGDSSSMGSREDDISSYEALRAKADSTGYEPEGLPGTGSTPAHSANFKISPPAKQVFHSGYDGRRDSINRVSTVMEGDEEDEEDFDREEQLTPKPGDAYRYGSPNLDERRNGLMFTSTPPIQTHSRHQSLDMTPEKQRKHASTGSSVLSGNPKISRWSRTTTSSVPEGYDSRRQSQEQRPLSDATLSSHSLKEFQNDRESIDSGHSSRISKGKQILPDERSLRSYRSDLTRTPSPLIPSEASATNQRAHADHLEDHLELPVEDDDFDDPKYSAVRNSLLLEHPQPRPGPTHRHQTNLESQAQDFGPSAGSLTGSDLSQRTVESDFDPSQWGSNPALSLARAHKLGRINPQAHASPVQSSAESSPRSAKVPYDDGPLLPIQKPDPEPEYTDDGDRQRTYQRSQAPPRTFDRLYYSSPLGSGHLLEPIEEVRYSLETDGGRMTPNRDVTPEPEPKVSKARLNPIRKITGPRPMVRNVSGPKTARE
ncbi:hypothetical protein K461DRAFT_322673 [Myriangium duriaei CBS 260.36]|uniref:Uncharacterized protein n=1 Tax=Myriangium duriaei CBS 260.36 TaxID=1168546 RepID=A0A9P4J169_9PEZI|nr:hypothetical protein K461DRAFT_322673 [Myriangium duriaei CBS 260.36]